MVVDDVEAHADAGGVRGVDEAGQRRGPAVGLVDGPQVDAVVAPARPAGESRYRHELDQVHSEPGQVGEALRSGIQGALRGEGAHMELVDDGAEKVAPRPAVVRPLQA